MRQFGHLTKFHNPEGDAIMPSNLPPGPASPAIVQGLQYALRPARFFASCAQRFGEVFTLRMPVAPGIAVMFTNRRRSARYSPATTTSSAVARRPAALRPLLGASSILALDGAPHERQRRLMMPPFHGERMLAYGDTMRAIADRAIERWPIGRPFPIHREMQAITLEVILRTVFGAEGARLDALRILVQRFAHVRDQRALALAAAPGRSRAALALGPRTAHPPRARRVPLGRICAPPRSRASRGGTTCSPSCSPRVTRTASR
jgi:cytochrome P450